MGNNSFLINWDLNVLPDSFQANAAGFLGSDSLAMAPANKVQVRHQAFAIGFFGFHYIRAANENELSLQKESLQILRELVMAYNLDVSFLGSRVVSRKQSYSDFWENVLRRISLALGDSLGSEAQRTVEFGFWLAAIYACFVGVLKDSDFKRFTRCLKIIEPWMIHLLMFAQQVGISEILVNPLVESIHLLQGSKTRRVACKSMRTLELVLMNLLLEEGMEG